MEEASGRSLFEATPVVLRIDHPHSRSHNGDVVDVGPAAPPLDAVMEHKASFTNDAGENSADPLLSFCSAPPSIGASVWSGKEDDDRSEDPEPSAQAFGVLPALSFVAGARRSACVSHFELPAALVCHLGRSG